MEVDITSDSAQEIIKEYKKVNTQKARAAFNNIFGQLGSEKRRKRMIELNRIRWDKYRLAHPKKENI